MNKFFRNLFIILAIFLVVSGIFMLFSGEKEPQNEVTLGKLADEVIASQVSKIEVADNNLTIYLKDGTKQVSTKEQEAALSDTLRNNYSVDPAKIKEANIVSVDSGSSSIFVSTILPFVIPFLFIAAFIWFLMKAAINKNGIKEAKEEL